MPDAAANAFGVVALILLMAFDIPQLVAVWRAPTLVGFSLRAWLCLAGALVSFTAQFALLQAWSGAAANGIGLIITAEIIRQILKKGA